MMLYPQAALTAENRGSCCRWYHPQLDRGDQPQSRVKGWAHLSSSRSQQNPPQQLHWAELADSVFKADLGYPGVLFADSSVRQGLRVAGNGARGCVGTGRYLKMSANFWGRECTEGYIYSNCSTIFWCYLISWNRKKGWNWTMLYSSVLGYKLIVKHHMEAQ